MKVVHLGYGAGQMALEIPEVNLAGVIDIEEQAGGDPPAEMVKEALASPVGTPALRELAAKKKARSALVVVNDLTRPTPYQAMLPPLLAELKAGGVERAGITLLVATGIHRPHSDEENERIYGREICQQYRVISHDCDYDTVMVGQLADGTPLELNRLVTTHDLIITTGLIGLHYFAGYSGGRKSILPGIASRRLITANHAMMTDPRCRLDNIEDNPVHKIMLEAARLAGVDFILNVVTDPGGHLVAAVAGDLVAAWEEGVRISRQLSTISLAETADIVVASCGGYPKDINLYQAQKALDGAALAVKEGGTIILVAECPEGLGEETFARWVREASSPADIEKRLVTDFELGGHKAYAICRLIKKASVILVSSLPVPTVESCFLEAAATAQEALQMAMERQGEEARVYIMPHAANVAVRVQS